MRAIIDAGPTLLRLDAGAAMRDNSPAMGVRPIFVLGSPRSGTTMIGNYLTTYGRKPEMDHQMVKDLGLSWRAYDGGGVEPTTPDPALNSVSHTGRHRIPILYEREVTTAPPATA